MQAWLVALRNRTIDFGPYEIDKKSGLINEVLIGCAAKVTCSWHMLDIPSLLAPPLRIRHLIIRNRYEAMHFGANHMLDFSSLATLETLEMNGLCRIRHPVSLPPSITTLKLEGAACSSPIAEMDKLVNLSTLTVLFYDAWNYASTDFITDANWPASLTSLAISIDNSDPRVYGSLPNNLINLSVRRSYGGTVNRMDVADLVRPQTRLRTLAVPIGRVIIGGKLPPTIEEIVLDELVIPRHKTALEIFGYLPLTLNRFACYSLRTSSSSYSLDPYDVGCAYRSILPRLSLCDLEIAYQLIMKDVPDAADDEFMSLLLELLKARQLDLKYIDAVRDRSNWPAHRFDLKHVACLLVNGSSADTIRLAIGSRVVYDSFYRSDFDRSHVKAYYRLAWVSLLSNRFTNSLNLIDCEPTFDVLRRVMPNEAVSNLVNLKISASSVLPLDALLTSNCLSSLETMDVLVGSAHALPNLIGILHKHAANLPRLDTIVIHSLCPDHAYRWLEMDEKQMLADMGLFLSHSKTRLVRFIQSPPSVLPPVQCTAIN
jgi:hypothetical protein